MYVFFIFAITLAAATGYIFSAEKPTPPGIPRASSPTQVPSPTDIPLPTQKTLLNDYHIFQSFNNCGPASLSMLLSYFGIRESQETLGQILRPYQNPSGDNDDKSVTLSELEQQAKTYGFVTFHRPNGDIAMLQKFIAADIPILTRTWLAVDDDIGHFRVIKGYDQTTQTIIQDDSYQGKNVSYTYADFTTMWEKFDNEYLVIVPKEKEQLARRILSRNTEEAYAWTKAKEKNEQILSDNPENIYARFNLSVALFHLNKYEQAITEYEKVETLLPARTLWYQIEPIQAYYEVGNYEKVFTLSTAILENQNRAYAELYILRGKSLQKQGNEIGAQEEFQKALFYNENLSEAKQLVTQ